MVAAALTPGYSGDFAAPGRNGGGRQRDRQQRNLRTRYRLCGQMQRRRQGLSGSCLAPALGALAAAPGGRCVGGGGVVVLVAGALVLVAGGQHRCPDVGPGPAAPTQQVDQVVIDLDVALSLRGCVPKGQGPVDAAPTGGRETRISRQRNGTSPTARWIAQVGQRLAYGEQTAA